MTDRARRAARALSKGADVQAALLDAAVGIFLRSDSLRPRDHFGKSNGRRFYFYYAPPRALPR